MNFSHKLYASYFMIACLFFSHFLQASLAERIQQTEFSFDQYSVSVPDNVQRLLQVLGYESEVDMHNAPYESLLDLLPRALAALQERESCIDCKDYQEAKELLENYHYALLAGDDAIMRSVGALSIHRGLEVGTNLAVCGNVAIGGNEVIHGNLAVDGTATFNNGQFVVSGLPVGTLEVGPGGVVTSVNGTQGFILKSNGPGVLPTFQSGSGLAITIIGDVGSASGDPITIYANNAMNNSGSSVEFVETNSTTLQLNVTDADNNTMIGKLAGNLGLTGTGNNTALGAGAGAAITTGTNNIIIGSGANASSAADTNDVIIGTGATASVSKQIRIGYTNTPSANTSVNTSAFIDGIATQTVANPAVVLINSVTGQLGTVSTGSPNLCVNNLTLTADPSTGTTGGSILKSTGACPGTTLFIHNTGSTTNMFAGDSAGNATVSGAFNTALGGSALHGLGAGIQNTAVGYEALQLNVTGNNNTALGSVALGNLSGGSNNTALGQNAGSAYTANEASNICIGQGVTGAGGESTITRIGNAQAACYVSGINGASGTSPAAIVGVNSNGQLITTTASGATGVFTSPGSIEAAAAGSGTNIPIYLGGTEVNSPDGYSTAATFKPQRIIWALIQSIGTSPFYEVAMQSGGLQVDSTSTATTVNLDYDAFVSDPCILLQPFQIYEILYLAATETDYCTINNDNGVANFFIMIIGPNA